MEVFPKDMIATRIDRISTQAEEENLVFQLGGESDDSPEAVFEVSMEDAIREIGRQETYREGANPDEIASITEACLDIWANPSNVESVIDRLIEE